MFLPTCNHFYDLRNQVALLPLLQDQHLHDLFFRVWTWLRFENLLWSGRVICSYFCGKKHYQFEYGSEASKI